MTAAPSDTFAEFYRTYWNHAFHNAGIATQGATDTTATSAASASSSAPASRPHHDTGATDDQPVAPSGTGAKKAPYKRDDVVNWSLEHLQREYASRHEPLDFIHGFGGDPRAAAYGLTENQQSTITQRIGFMCDEIAALAKLLPVGPVGDDHVPDPSDDLMARLTEIRDKLLRDRQA